MIDHYLNKGQNFTINLISDDLLRFQLWQKTPKIEIYKVTNRSICRTEKGQTES